MTRIIISLSMLHNYVIIISDNGSLVFLDFIICCKTVVFC